jgi:UV DNA damage endonuclease
MFRLGLCCIFRDQPIRFRAATATAVGRLRRADALRRLSGLCLENAEALAAALRFCADNDIGCFRINSRILPLKTHPEHGYDIEELPDGREIVRRFKRCGRFARRRGIRTCFHPDQFVVLNSPRAEVVHASLAELEYQAEVAGWVGADVVNIHAGGAYGDKKRALVDLARNMNRLSRRARRLLTVENDDRIYTPVDLLPFCRNHGVPLVYDVHHHRCNPDRLSLERATRQAIGTWNREPLFHVSSPLGGWRGPDPRRHADYVNLRDFPILWQSMDLTVEVEAKAKELAVLKLDRAIRARARRNRRRSPAVKPPRSSSRSRLP